MSCHLDICEARWADQSPIDVEPVEPESPMGQQGRFQDQTSPRGGVEDEVHTYLLCTRSIKYGSVRSRGRGKARQGQAKRVET